ncbi:hypothetical protein B0H13DRAFT_2452612 [Mycena leptocephala]|nr:hypothetical protein B0H13DRAFT_2452612 [Mycena leptocephala]
MAAHPPPFFVNALESIVNSQAQSILGRTFDKVMPDTGEARKCDDMTDLRPAAHISQGLAIICTTPTKLPPYFHGSSRPPELFTVVHDRRGIHLVVDKLFRSVCDRLVHKCTHIVIMNTLSARLTLFTPSPHAPRCTPLPPQRSPFNAARPRSLRRERQSGKMHEEAPLLVSSPTAIRSLKILQAEVSYDCRGGMHDLDVAMLFTWRDSAS